MGYVNSIVSEALVYFRVRLISAQQMIRVAESSASLHSDILVFRLWEKCGMTCIYVC